MRRAISRGRGRRKHRPYSKRQKLFTRHALTAGSARDVGDVRCGRQDAIWRSEQGKGDSVASHYSAVDIRNSFRAVSCVSWLKSGADPSRNLRGRRESHGPMRASAPTANLCSLLTNHERLGMTGSLHAALSHLAGAIQRNIAHGMMRRQIRPHDASAMLRVPQFPPT